MALDPEFTDITREEYERFIRSPLAADLERNVTRICEPPLENFNDFTGAKVWPQSMVAKARLESIFPGVVDKDPRPADERPTSWWREDCCIRHEWLARFRREASTMH